jgi:hypothetical protein
MNYEEFCQSVMKTNEKLLATDPRFRHDVLITHEDGSIFFYDSAFLLMSQNHKYIAVFTEHHGMHTFDIDSLLCYKQYKKDYTEPAVLET